MTINASMNSTTTQNAETGGKPARRVPDRKAPLRRLALLIRNQILRLRTSYLRYLGMDIHPDSQISLKANLDRTNPRGVHIGQGTLVAFGAVILTHDLARVLHTDTYIGRNCFIGAHSILLPGIHVGDGSIVATGSVVTKNVEPNCIVAGNPAKVIKSGIRTRKWGVLEASYFEAVEVQTANEHREHDDAS